MTLKASLAFHCRERTLQGLLSSSMARSLLQQPPSQTKTGLSGDSARNPSAHRVLATGFGQQLGDILTNTAARSCQAVRGGHPALGLQLKLRQQQVRRPQLRNERDSADGRCNRALHSRVSISQTPIMLRSSVSLIRP